LAAKVKEKKMANKRLWLGTLVMVLVFMMLLVGCVSNYHIQTFTDIVEVVPNVSVENIRQEYDSRGELTGKVYYSSEKAGIFEASDYDTVMEKAKDAGFTKVLSVEYGTNLYLGFIGTKWVKIRCIKDVGILESQ
jgi:hypothetical protein